MVQTISQTRSSNLQPTNQRANKLTGLRFHSAPQNKRVGKNFAVLNAPPTTTSNASNTNASNTPLIAQPQTTDSITSDSLASNGDEEKSIWKWVLGALALIGGLALGAFLLRNKGGDKPSKSSQTNEVPEAAVAEEKQKPKTPIPGNIEDIADFMAQIQYSINSCLYSVDESYALGYLKNLISPITVKNTDDKDLQLSKEQIIEILTNEHEYYSLQNEDEYDRLSSVESKREEAFADLKINERIVKEQILPVVTPIVNSETHRIQTVARLSDQEKGELTGLFSLMGERKALAENIIGEFALLNSSSISPEVILEILCSENRFEPQDNGITLNHYLRRQEILDKYGITFETVQQQIIPHVKRKLMGADDISQMPVLNKEEADKVFYSIDSPFKKLFVMSNTQEETEENGRLLSLFSNVVGTLELKEENSIPPEAILNILENEWYLFSDVSHSQSLNNFCLTRILQRHEYCQQYEIDFKTIQSKIIPQVKEKLIEQGLWITSDPQEILDQFLSYSDLADINGLACSNWRNNDYRMDIDLSQFTEPFYTEGIDGKTITINPKDIDEILKNEGSIFFVNEKLCSNTSLDSWEEHKPKSLFEKRIKISSRLGCVLDSRLLVKLIKHAQFSKDWHALKSLNPEVYNELHQIWDLGEAYIGLGSQSQQKILELKKRISEDQTLIDALEKTLGKYQNNSYNLTKFLQDNKLFKIADCLDHYFEKIKTIIQEIPR